MDIYCKLHLKLLSWVNFQLYFYLERKSSLIELLLPAIFSFLWRHLPRSLLVRAIDDARVAGVTFSLCSCHDNSTVFRGKLSVLTAELTKSSLSNLRETLQLIWSSGCNSASKSRVRSLPWKFSAVFKTCCSLVHLSGCLSCHRCYRWEEKHV